ncbi:hypothetical protein GUY44_15590 [Pimelobacter simplex]|nr:phospholipase D-like domain-containing protein [Pimelobacter simplex]MCG8151911.1 hypothetical protein [Pimelobacter simplex]GEB12670.1 hypothetical protein NSI01_09850 [Pimelobacter simplex]SFM56059.1 Phosphatidylserine/phosphatidylglycerophosphate/cardiolipin synthase [Pimelobacter simplex]
MRRAGTGFVIGVTALAVGLGLGALPGAHASAPEPTVAVVAPSSVEASAPAAVDRKKKAKRDHYNPNPGLRFNEPYSRGGKKATNIRRHILRSIDSTRKGDVIQMAAWNIRGRSWMNALIRAHKRGVAVQVIMDKVNWSREHPNPEAAAVAKVLKGKENRPVQSWLRTCAGSCRGARGIPHSKFYLFSRVEDRKYVTMFGSNNATDVAANDQWNDLYTWVNNKTIYDTFVNVFNQMKLDKNQGSKGYVAAKFSPTQSVFFYPYKGAVPTKVGDPDMARLNQIKCTGATGGAGYNGRTKIRIMQTAIHGDRGIRLAQKLVQLKKAGCDIRIVYALMGNNVHQLLTANKVQKLQLAYDRDRNGVYDIYLHLKSLAISGNYQGVTNARVTYNGSANWSSVPLASDDVVGEFRDVAMTKAYIDWTDFLYNHRPGSWGSVNLAPVKSSVVEGRIMPVDPYSFMKENGL